MIVGHLTRDPLDVQALLAQVAAPERGGTACFVGSVRAGPDDGPVIQITYSGYEAMVEEEFARIVAEAEAKWPGCAVAAQHRLGDVSLGEASIAVAAAAPHRAAAFAACRHVIEEAKRRLPVWKQEHFADGSAGWRENDVERTAPDRAEPR